MRSIGLDDHVHADFGSGLWEGEPIGIPFTVVNRRTARQRVRFDYAGESDRVRYPIPRRVRIEGGSDRHALLVERGTCRLYELFALRRASSDWLAGRLGRDLEPAPTSRPPARLDVRRRRRAADPARCSRVPGRIDHALRVTVSRTRRAYVWPARHFASGDTRPEPPADGRAAAPEGERRHLRPPAPGPPRRARDAASTG